MLEHADMTAAIDEPKSARMEQRTKPHVKERIDLAAALLGIDASAFITSAAYECANRTIKAHARTELAAEDHEVFFAALENPAAPTDALKSLFATHRARVVDE